MVLPLMACTTSSVGPDLPDLEDGHDPIDDPRPSYPLSRSTTPHATALDNACMGISLVDEGVAGDPGEEGGGAEVGMGDAAGDALCPAYEGWLLDGTLAQLRPTLAGLPDLLDRFCVYHSASPEAAPIEHEALTIDCPAAEPLSAWPNAVDLDETLSALFLAQVGMVEPSYQGTHPVQVAVVDTDPPQVNAGLGWNVNFNQLGLSPHGSAVANIVEDLACPGGGVCPVQTSHFMALPMDGDGEQAPDGGFYGTRIQVALALMEAVDAWQSEIEANPAAPAPRLVINLSVGWVTTLGLPGGPDEAEPWATASSHVAEFVEFVQSPPAVLDYPTQMAVEAVHGALLYAACQGAVIVAAAGNAKNGSCNENPVAPATWARYATPTAKQCEDLGFRPQTDLAAAWWPSEGSPLLIPVAAVDHKDEPIAVTRPDSLTRLVAPGAHATVPRQVGLPLEPMTGTSAAAAVTSAAAALLWSHDPNLTPTALVDTLYMAGISIGRTAELPQYSPSASPAPPSHRLSLCQALDALPNPPAPSSTCAHSPALSDALVQLTTNVSEVKSHNELHGIAFDTQPGTSSGCSFCGDTVDVSPSATSPVTDPLLAQCSAPPPDGPQLAGPQPTLAVCPDCPLTTTTLVLDANTTLHSAVAHLAISDRYQDLLAPPNPSHSLVGAWIELEFGGTINPLVVDLDGNTLEDLENSNHTVKVSLDDLPGVVSRATVGLTLQKGNDPAFTRSNAILVTP